MTSQDKGYACISIRDASFTLFTTDTVPEHLHYVTSIPQPCQTNEDLVPSGRHPYKHVLKRDEINDG
jgi:predicted Zn-dependent protease